MKRHNILTAALAAMILAGCSGDFLDKKPLDKLSEEDVFKSATLIEFYVNQFYAAMPDFFQEGNVACITDEAFFRYGGTSTNYIARGLMTPDNVLYWEDGGPAHDSRTTTLNIWNRAYKYIRNMNYLIDKVENDSESPLSEAQKAKYLGETYFFRAWMYFNLVQRYAGVPIITDLYNIGDKYGVTRNDYDECIEFIMSDLEKAEALLPAKASERGRVGGDVCLALAARVRLTAASPLFNDPENPQGGIFRGAYSADKFTLAKEACEAIIKRIDEDNAYALAATYDDYWANVDSKEVIWAKYFNVNSGNKAQLLYSPVYISGWQAIEPTEAMVIDYEMAATGKKIFEDGSGYDPMKPFDGRDPRFYKTIATLGCTWTDDSGDFSYEPILYYGTQSSPLDIADYTKDTERSSRGKFMWDDNSDIAYTLKKWHISGQAITESETITPMMPWFRVGEMYLNYAEACYLCGDEDGCRRYINKVRSRADVMMPEVTDGGANLWDRLIHERRIELAYECGFRYFDLRRWKLAPFFECVGMYGSKNLAFYAGSDPEAISYTDESGNNLRILIRNARKWDPDGAYRQRDYYNEQTPNIREGSDHSDLKYTYNGRTYRIQNNVVTYSWLGQEYVVDYGLCTSGFMSPNKDFPYLNGAYPNYLMPIPSNEILKSEGSIIQNPGY